MIKRLDFALYRSTYVDRLLFFCRTLEFDYLMHLSEELYELYEMATANILFEGMKKNKKNAEQ